MSITFTKTPKTIDFTGNGLAYEVFGNYISTWPETAIVMLSYTGPLSGYIEFKNFDTGAMFRIDFVASPNDEKNEISSALNTVQDIADALNSLYIFNRFYYAYVSGSKLVVRTKTKRYIDWVNDMTLPACFSIYGSPLDGADAVYKEDYSIFMQINWFEGSTNPQLIAELGCMTDNEGTLKIELGDVLKSVIRDNKPNLSLTRSNFPLENFSVNFAEKYAIGGVPNVNRFYSNSFYALKGKINTADYDLIADINSRKMFLNHFSQADIFTGANYILHFYNTASVPEEIRIKAKIYYTDRSDSTQTIETFISGGAYNIEWFNAGIEAMGIKSYYPDKEIYKYEVWVERTSGSVLIAGQFTFNVIEPPMFYKEFAFLNKYGVFEFFHPVSKENITMVLEKNIVKKQDSTFEDSFIEAYNQFKLSTGSLSREQAIEIEYMLMSEALYEVNGEDYTKLIIEPASITIIEDSADTVSIEFTYRQSNQL